MKNVHDDVFSLDLGIHEAKSASLETDVFAQCYTLVGGSVAEWLACWTQAQKGPGSNRSRDAVG